MRCFTFFLLFFIAFSTRTVIHIGPNIEFVTVCMLLAGYYLGRKESALLVFLVMMVSDIFLGNTNIFLFTWSGFLFPAYVAYPLLKRDPKRVYASITATSTGIFSTLFFFFWTNFGVWLLDAWGMYSRDISGLFMSYINGLPFLKIQLLSNLFLVPAGFFCGEIIRNLHIRLVSKKNMLLFSHIRR